MKSYPLVISILTLIAVLALFAAPQSTQPATRPSPLNITLQYSLAADASTVIQQAVDRIVANGMGGTLTLSPGTWSLKTAITIVDSTENITLAGRGAYLIMQANAPPFGPGAAIWLQNDSNVTIQDFRFNGNRAVRGFDGSTHTVLLNWSNNVAIKNCSFTGATGDDIFMWGGLNCPMPPCKNIRVINSAFSDPGRNCITLVNAKYVTVDYCSFTNVNGQSPSTAVECEPNGNDPVGCVSDLEIERCTFNQCFHAIWAQNIGVTAPMGLTVVSNTINGGTYGIESQWGNGLIAHNVINGTSSFPIVTGGYPAGTGSRIWQNQVNGCPAMATAPSDVTDN